LSKASPIAEVSASSNQMFWIGVIAIDTSRITSGSAGASLSHRGSKPFR
jgi:hypothetical protein